MPNGTFNPFDDNFITSDLQDHVILDEDEEEVTTGRGGRRDRGNDDDDHSDYNVDNDGDDSDWDSKKGKPSSRRSGRKRGRPSRSLLTRNGSSSSATGASTRTSSGRVVKPTLFADDGDEDYVRSGPKRKRGRPPSKPIQDSSFKGMKENPRLSGSRTYQARREPKDRCNLCNIVLKNDGMIVEHIKTDHVVPSMNPDDLIVQKTGIKSFLCSLCGSSFDARIKYKFHKRSKHGLTGGTEEDDANVECDLCESILEDKGELIIHKDTKHTNLKTYHCDYCNDKYFTSEELIDHRRVMHEDQVNKITDPWVSIERDDDILSYPGGQGYAKVQKRSADEQKRSADEQKRSADEQKRSADEQKSPAGRKSFPKRILLENEGIDLPPSSPEKSPGNTSSSDFEPDGKDDDDDDFDPSFENSSKKRNKSSSRKKGRPSRSAATDIPASLESLGIEGLSKEGLENFKSAPAEIQKKVLKLLADKRGRDAVMKRLSASGSPGRSSAHSIEQKIKKKKSISELTSKLQATLNRLLEKKRVFDCPECPHRFPSKELLARHEKSAHSYKPPPKPVFTGSCQICHEPIPNEKDYVQHLLSKHMTPDVDVLSVAAGILVKRVAKDPGKAKKRKRSRPSAASAVANVSTVSNDGSGTGTHDLDMSGDGPTTSRTTIEPVIDDGESH